MKVIGMCPYWESRPILPPLPGATEMRTQTYHAINEIAEERERQISEEGWTAAHDDAHTPRKGRGDVGPLAEAASCYIHGSTGVLDLHWPWGRDWWKPVTYRRNLVKAAALIVAELERLERLGE